ncbi:MAG TPA: hypothetical protein VEQ37_13590 [Actinomycetota bacterium]|nr:hypothetical protein [Actinomycetota bacterium]
MDRRPHFFSRPTFPLVTGGASLLILLGVACGGKAPSSSPAASVSPAEATTSPGSLVPALTILSPRSGQRVLAPVPIRYRVGGFVPGKTSLIVYLGEPGSSLSFEFPLASATGVIRLEDHPMLSGKRTLTFKLAMNHQPLEDAEAEVILPNVIIEGERGAA